MNSQHNFILCIISGCRVSDDGMDHADFSREMLTCTVSKAGTPSDPGKQHSEPQKNRCKVELAITPVHSVVANTYCLIANCTDDCW